MKRELADLVGIDAPIVQDQQAGEARAEEQTSSRHLLGPVEFRTRQDDHIWVRAPWERTYMYAISFLGARLG